jgi:hypothetical protein
VGAVENEYYESHPAFGDYKKEERIEWEDIEIELSDKHVRTSKNTIRQEIGCHCEERQFYRETTETARHRDIEI